MRFQTFPPIICHVFAVSRWKSVVVANRLALWVFAALLIVGFMLISGCGSGADDLAGRVAIDVSVQTDGTPVQDGTLVLRPEPGVKCPLITIPIVAGSGHQSEAQGPVPGSYQASFRPAGADLTEQLSAAGRLNPASGSNNRSSSKRSTADTIRPLQPTTLVVPDRNPASVTLNFVTK